MFALSDSLKSFLMQKVTTEKISGSRAASASCSGCSRSCSGRCDSYDG